MSRSYKHNPGYVSQNSSAKRFAHHKERRSSLDTIGYLSYPERDPLISMAKRGFSRVYSSWDIHDERFIRSRKREEHWLASIMENEEEATCWLGENWRDVPYERLMYEDWAHLCYWK
jgi:hypothetical protein